MMDPRSTHLVELVDEAGRGLGSSTVEVAHQAPGQLHRAFSVVLVDPGGRLLLQQRAQIKSRFPLRWANACCGHPAPGEEVISAATKRLGEELGLDPVALAEVGVYRYFAEDPATGRVEYEYDHVLLGAVDTDVPVRPDPQEVAAVRWVSLDEVRTELREQPRAYAPWLGGVLEALPFTQDAAERSGGR